ncbi:MAG: phenylalanine--tRNA ligase subunit beta [Planctomycetota bacterium]
MHISYRWLGRHVDLEGVDANRVAELLTLHTAEVEGVERFAPALADVVVGHVLTKERHPDADKLSVCTVEVGESEPLQIVCGAPNVAAGMKVAVARIGTHLPGDLKIKKGVIRGVESRGMICSERELGLGDEHDGIWPLETDAPVGTPVDVAVDAVDHVIEIDNKSLTHRPDLWGHRGIAREIAALLGRELRPLDARLPEPRGDARVAVDVATAGCSRYLAVPIGGVEGGRSPLWMRLLLLAAGQRPLDVLVDVSNFVMLDLGQPNHLFDRSAIGPAGIVVRDARPGEVLRTLDDVERSLTPADMLICAGDEPVALAGVMGGEGSKVAAGTKELLLEVATFDPARVRRTSARLGLRTDSSARFEKHLDPLLPLEAAGHLVGVLREVRPNAHLAGPVTDAGTWKDPSCVVDVRPARVRALLGTDVDDARIESILTALDFGVDRANGETWRVTVPARRATKDVTIEEDLVEEVGRSIGYDTIAEKLLVAPVAPAPRDARRKVVRTLADRLAGAARFREAMTYSFTDDATLATLRLDGAPHARVLNPVAEGVSRLRRSVVPSLVALVQKNLLHREDVRLFEVGKGTRPEVRDDRGHPGEVHRIGLVLARRGASSSFRDDVLLELEGVIADALSRLGAGDLVFDHAEGASDELASGPDLGWAHPRRRVVGRLGGTAVAFAADVDPRVAHELGIEGQAAGAEISIDALLEATGGEASGTVRYHPIPRFPGLEVDVALAAPAGFTAREADELIRRAGKGLVARTELFDVYRGENLGEGRKSLAWHVVLQAADRTLGEADQTKFLDRLERMGAEHAVELRRQ